MNLKNTDFKSNSRIFSTENVIVMGILNLTKDSFYDGGKYLKKNKIVARCQNMLDEGASIIDIGAQSSRPGATNISSKEETKKLISEYVCPKWNICNWAKLFCCNQLAT